MTQTVLHPTEKTLGEFIKANYPDFTIDNGDYIALDTDITHGLEFERIVHERYFTYTGETVHIYPYVKFTDGCYHPVYFDWNYRITLYKKA